MTHSDDMEASAQLLRRAAEVLLTCVKSVAQIEDLISPWVLPAMDGAGRLSLQEIDILRQRLEGIATCLIQISNHDFKNGPIEMAHILAPLLLDDLKLRLMGTHHEVHDRSNETVLF